jgi:hypothetical protein
VLLVIIYPVHGMPGKKVYIENCPKKEILKIEKKLCNIPEVHIICFRFSTISKSLNSAT